MVTGGCGFIGSAFVLGVIANTDCSIVNIDNLTYAGNPENLSALAGSSRYVHIHADICDSHAVKEAISRYRPDALVNFAAESHVDRSIAAPRKFIETNVIGTLTLLEAVRDWWGDPAVARSSGFRFLHVSTDEVYGSLEPDDPPFTEQSAYAPNSPYAASKAASDHLVRAYGRTYGLPVLVTNCSNNFGPRQFPEKLIPLMIVRAIAGDSLPLYGDGKNVRDWLYVEDHCSAIWEVLLRGVLGETYNIGGGAEMSNLEIVGRICQVLNELRPRADGIGYESQIVHVQDRPGHDRRYAIDGTKMARELGWRSQNPFAESLRKTVQWYLANPGWIERVNTGEYRRWVRENYQVARES